MTTQTVADPEEEGEDEEMPQADLEHFLQRGFLVVPSHVDVSVNKAIHDHAMRICSRGQHAAARLGDDVLPAIEELCQVINAPPVRRSLRGVLGKGYMLHAHRHLHISSGCEQMWHKDSYWHCRKIRHHRPRWCMLLYYPQDTTLDMGPTHVLAGSQYWCINSEHRKHGEDILTPDSGNTSMFVKGTAQERGEQLRQAADSLTSAAQQSLGGGGGQRQNRQEQQQILLEDVPLVVPAGTCVLMHYDLFHRAGFRLPESTAPMRCMFKFQFLRTTEPPLRSPPTPPIVAGATPLELDPVIQDIRSWLRGHWLESPWQQAAMEQRLGDAGEQHPSQALLASSESEVKRIEAAYSLGRSRPEHWSALLQALRGEEAVARAAMYGLVAAGPEVELLLWPFLADQEPRIRSAAAFVLGEAAKPSQEFVDQFLSALESEKFCMVEAAFLQSLACVASRARALSDESLCRRIIDACLPYLTEDGNGLRRENATLVVLMAFGLDGDLSDEAVGILERTRDAPDETYAPHLAQEVLRRYRRVRRPSRIIGQVLEKPVQETMDAGRLSCDEMISPNPERSTPEKKSRLSPVRCDSSEIDAF